MEHYPLLQSQMGVFAECIKNPDSAGYNLPYVCKLPDDIDLQKLKKAWEKLLARHRAFRTRFGFDEKGEVYQYSDDTMVIPVILRYDRDALVQEYIRNGFMRSFDLMSGEPLIRVELVETEKGKYQLMDMSHVIGDGTSVITVINHTELPALYEGQEPEMPATDLYEAAVKEMAETGGEEYRKAKAYYQELFADVECATLCSNPPKEPQPMIRDVLGMERETVDRWCEEHGVRVHHLFRAAFVYVMGTLCRQEKLAYFSSHAGRGPETRNAVGMFVKSVPLVDTVDEKSKVIDYIRKFGEKQPCRLSAYPFTHFCAELKKEPLISFNFMGVPSFEETLELGGHTIPCGVMVRGTTNADLSVHVYWHQEEYEIRLESSEGLNDHATLQMVGKAIRTVMLQMMETPEKPLKDIVLTDDAETEALMALSRGIDLEYDRSQTWLDLFRKQVEEGPDRPAVSDRTSEMTYRELDEASDRLAAWLAARGVQAGNFVAVRLPRSREFIAAIAGIHKAGAAYVPVDPAYPPERVDYMLEDSEAKLLISSLSFDADGMTVNGETESVPAGKPEGNSARVTPDDLAYMIYTSGSTGKPKGAMLTHRGLMNFTVSTALQNELTPADRVASHRSFSFDAHIEDVFPVLASGACIHIMPEEIRKDLDAMADFLRERQITGCGFTTSIAKLLIQGYELPVRYMTAGGEALTHIGSDRIQIINEYGPTECTNDTCVYKLEKGRFYTSVPVGRPMPNSWCFVLDSRGHLLPRGASGELCYAGPQVGRGYWKLDEKTAEVFGDCPFVPGQRMYRTGDLARWNSEGQLECLGRMDHQVKLRGYRIEMGEIESLAASAPGVSMAAAAVRQIGNAPHLVLYYTEKENGAASEEEVRSVIEHSSLAEYMHPDIYMKLDELPKLPNGKINRKQLPEPELTGKQEYEAPADAKEEAVIAAMKTALGLDARIGALDSFFEWGGDSIKAIRMVSILRQAGLTVSVSDIMALKTVRRIAAACRAEQAVRAEQAAVSGPVGVSPIYEHFFASDYANPAHFNQAALYRCAGRADLKALQRATDALTGQHDMLRAICRDGQVVIRSADVQIPVETLDLRKADDFRRAAEKACEKIQRGIRMEEALLRVCLIGGPEEDYVFFCAHHLIIDGVSWRILKEDLENAYRQAAEGAEKIRLAEKTHAYPDFVKAMSAYRETWKLNLETPYWKRAEKKVCALPHRALREGRGQYGHLTLRLEQAETGKILSARMEKWKLEINDLWLTAVCESFLSLSGQGSVSVQMEGHGRENIGAGLLTDRTVGWFTSMYPAVFEGVTGSLEHDLLNIKETLRRIPNRGVGYQLARTPLNAPESAVPWISFNYLGEMDAEEQGDSFFRQENGISSGPIWDEGNYQGSALLINAFVQQGQLTLMLDYDRSVYAGEDAERFARQVTENLAAAAACLSTAEEKTTASDLGETEWGAEEFEAVRAEFAARGETIQRILPMSGMQEAMLLKHLTSPESPAYRLVFVYRCEWLPTEESLNRAFSHLLARHEVLRSAIVHEGVSAVRQVITDRVPKVEMLDYSGSKNPDSMVLNLRKILLKNGFDLQRKPLFRLVFIRDGENSGYLMTVSHHIIQDGWSMQLYMDDLKAMLEAERRGTPLPEAESNPGAYERAVRELALKDRRPALRYWGEMLGGYETKAEIPSYGEIPAEARQGDEAEIAVSAEVTEKLNALCTQEGATISNGIELIWGLVLQTFARSRDVIFGKVVSGRDNTETDVSKVVGLFINTVPVRLRTEEKTTAREALRSLQQQAAASSEYDFCMLSEIMGAAGLENGLLQTVMAFENYSSGREENPFAASLLMSPFCMKEENFDAINPVMMIDGKGQLRLHIGYDPAKYYPAEIRRILNMFRHFAGIVTEFPDTQLRRLPRTDTGSAAEIAELSCGNALAYDRSKTFIDLFVSRAAQDPEHEAVVDGSGQYTYGELDRISNRVAAWLLAHGAGTGSFVAVRMPRMKEFMAAVIGVMKAGAAYIPVDPEYPEDRIRYMLEDSGAKLELTRENMAEWLAGTDGEAEPVNRSSPEIPAYMIYTSGSTGKPKGVVQSHRSLGAFLAWRRELLQIGENSRHAQIASFSFDASLDDLICPLAFGGSVHIFGDELRKDLAGMNHYFHEKKITGLTMSTQIGMAMIDQFPDLPLQFLMMGGEKMLPFRKTSVRVINGYGPTEFTVCSSYHEVNQEKDRNIPIGRPVPNTWSLICDDAGRLLPRGLAGELCLAGPQIAEGYWKREELTEEKFSPIPEISLLTGEDTRVYHTGDLARYNEAGELEYLGRIDDQVKLRGFRIELGEIENAAAQYEGIGRVAAKVCRQTLCLYYTAEGEPDESGLRSWLESNLAEYMVPSVFMRLDQLPLTPNGKVNKKLLPEPDLASAHAYEAPEGAAEETLARVMQATLGLDQPVGANDNFFELGGDSIKAIRMVSQLRNEHLTLQVSDVMKYKTVRAIARAASPEESTEICQDPIAGETGTSPIMGFFRDLALPKPMHFNQNRLLACRERMDAERLRRAMKPILRQHDLLRAVVKDGALIIREWNEQQDSLRMTEADLADRKDWKREITRMCDEAQASFCPEDQLLRIMLFHAPDRDYLFLCAHHLLIDGVSWSILLGDLESAYAQAAADREIRLPMKTCTYRDYVKAAETYRQSYAMEQEIPYWKRVEEKMRSMPGSDGKDYRRRFGMLEFTADKGRTKKILQARIGNYNAERNDYLLVALAAACRGRFGWNRFSVQLEGHGREPIFEGLHTDRTVGWFTSVYPVVFENLTGETGTDFRNVKETLHRIPNKGAGYNILRFIPGTPDVQTEKDRWAMIGFNYLGEIDTGRREEGLFETAEGIGTGMDAAAENLFGPDLMINCWVENGKFRMNLQYNMKSFDEARIKGFAEGYLRELVQIADDLDRMEEPVQTASDLGETQWSDSEFTAVVKDFAARGEKLERIYPLTPMQEGILLKYLSEKDSWAYRLVTILRLDFVPEPELLTRCMNLLMEKHPVLRSAIIYDGVSEYRQAITNRKAHVETVDLTAEADKEAAVLALRKKILTNNYELQRKPLVQLISAKTGGHESYLLIATHHIIVDGWCIPLLADEAAELIRTGKIAGDGGSYETAVREVLGRDRRKGMEYWAELLDGYETAAEIPVYPPEPAECSETDIAEILIDRETTERLSELCRKEQVTIGTAVELAWALLIGTASGTDDVVYAKVVSGRDNSRMNVDRIIGLFINAIPVRVRTDAETTVASALKALQAQAARSNEYDYCALSDILELTPLGNKLFQSVFAFENYNSGAAPGKDGLKSHAEIFYSKEENIDLLTPSASLTETGELRFRIVYDNTQYREAEMQRIVRLYSLLIHEIAEKPEECVWNLRRVSREDEQEIIALGRGEELAYDPAKTWVDLFLERVAEDGNRLAVDDGSNTYTYAELNDTAGRLAAWLKAQGVRANDFVAVRLPRCREFVAAILAVHKLGAAYVPIDPAYPENRVSYMLENSEAKVMIELKAFGELGGERYDGRPAPENLAYMIYTSGSTGKPKGAMLHQRGLMNFTVATAAQNELTPADRVANHRSFSFDAHIEDIFPVLSSGASIHIMPEEIRKDFEAIDRFIRDHRITGCGFTTSIGKTLLTDFDLPVRYMTVGGEALTGVVSGKIQIINEYGPTECTNDTCVYKLDYGRRYRTIPVGRPMPNSWCFITDRHGNLVPRGFMGELCYAGPQVGSGYWKLPERTAQAFGDCPFVDGVRMYRTGDFARYNEEGQIETLGRMDGQVKLRGYRIETGEVEEAALQNSRVQTAVAAVVETGGARHLVLYYTQKGSPELTEDELRHSVERTALAEYMRPEIYMKLDEMPRLPNGKINRRALPLPERNLRAENVKPSTAKETHFLNAAKEILPGIEFGVTDDLFSLGLTSLTAMRLIVKINALPYHDKYRVSDIMRYKSIQAMIRGNRRIYWQYDAYDPKKPYLVFLYGIAPVAQTLAMLEKWSNAYNILVIEPIDAHYDILFDEQSIFEDVVDTYALMLEQNIPEDARLAGMVGFSWGGTLAYRLCERWSRFRNEKPFAMLGDTYLINAVDGYRQQEVSEKDFPENLFDLTAGAITRQEVVRKTNISIRMDNTVTAIPAYDGSVIMLNALKNYSEELKRANLELLKKLAKNAEIIDFPNHSHNDLFFDEHQVPIFLKLMLQKT